jgi:hypothetical protein
MPIVRLFAWYPGRSDGNKSSHFNEGLEASVRALRRVPPTATNNLFLIRKPTTKANIVPLPIRPCSAMAKKGAAPSETTHARNRVWKETAVYALAATLTHYSAYLRYRSRYTASC